MASSATTASDGRALHRASGTGLWIGRPAEWPGSRPLELEPELGADLGGLREWARENVVKLLCFCHPDDDAETCGDAGRAGQAPVRGGAAQRLEFLLEVIPSKVGPVDDDTTATLIQRFYDAGVYSRLVEAGADSRPRPLGPTSSPPSTRNDPRTRGIVVLGLDAPEEDLAASFALAAQQPLVKGFAVGRTIFGDAARDWLAGDITDGEAVAEMAGNYTPAVQHLGQGPQGRRGERRMSKTIRLTAAQAMVRYLAAQTDRGR